jgi:hypothetical protein
MGRVLAFKTSCENKGLDFCDEDSSNFANGLLNHGNEIVLKRIKLRLESLGPSLGLSDSAVVQICEVSPELFANRQQVVKFGDLNVRDGDLDISIGMSATVCKGSKKSKIWTRVSGDSGPEQVGATTEVLSNLRSIAEAICEEMASVYHERLNEFLLSIGDVDVYTIDTKHVFLLEAGDYESAKLFDTITTLRETANFFTVYNEGDWSPLSDLFEFANSRLSPEMEMSKLNFSDVMSDNEIERVTDFFNAESKALTWEVTLGRHGLFAVDEMTADPQTGSSRTHMVGLCAGHIQPDPSMKRLSSSWLVSGNYAPRLGATF